MCRVSIKEKVLNLFFKVLNLLPTSHLVILQGGVKEIENGRRGTGFKGRMQKILETGMLNKDIYNRGLIHRVTGKLQKRAIILNIPPNVLSVTKGKMLCKSFVLSLMELCSLRI
jgi:hypothetical protein